MSSSFEDLRAHIEGKPAKVALVLGSGLNQVTDGFPCLCSVPFRDLPGMPGVSVAGHRGLLGLFEMAGRRVLVFQGRVHYYEGHDWDTVERPINLAAELGVRQLILTNAAGGIGPRQDAGALMSLTAHVHGQRRDWWKQTSPMAVYSSRIRAALQGAAQDVGHELPEGVYAGLTGPCYETPAEIRALQAMGADAVGMSTIHEAQTAVSLGMEVAAVSCIANRAAGLSAEPLSHADVLAVVNAAANQMSQLLRAVVARC